MRKLAVAIAAILSACATIQEPPGGPPDLTPPVIVSVAPDSGAVVPKLEDAAVFRFNELVLERPAQAMEQLVLLSPRPRGIKVSWKRDAIEVKPREGWLPGVVYRLTLLPGITDLRNNRLDSGRTLVFSTGAEIPATTITGRVVDWEAGAAGARALVEAIHQPDSVTYWDLADSAGMFRILAVPPGEYTLAATLDRNNNRRRDFREPFDSGVVRLDSSVTRTFWAFTHDTAGPRIRTVSRADSVSVRIDFNQPLRPGVPDSTAVRLRLLPDSTPVALAGIMTQQVFDSLQSRARPAAGDTAANRAAPQGGQPAIPQGGQPAVPPPPRGPPTPQPQGGPVRQGPARADTALTRLVAERGRLTSALIVRTAAPLAAGARYVVDATVTNPTGASATSNQVLVIPAAPDSTNRRPR